MLRKFRVQLAPHLDAWMQGDRYGFVVGQKRNGMYLVEMDRSGRVLTFHPDHVRVI